MCESAPKTFTSLLSFTSHVLVKCPYCEGRASITKSNRKAKPIFSCTNCFKLVDVDAWYGPVVLKLLYSRCGNCGNDLRYEEITKAPPKTKVVQCAVCNSTKEYPTEYEKIYASNNIAIDPHLGLPLWLQTSVQQNLLWAYNHDHLQHMKAFVSAKLRDSTSSYARKLPEFITSAKNRTKVMKAIEKLEKL